MRYVFPWDTTEKGLCSENHPVEETARSGRRFERDAIALAFERVNGSIESGQHRLTVAHRMQLEAIWLEAHLVGRKPR